MSSVPAALTVLAMNRNALSRLLRAGLVTSITDGLFSSILATVFYHSAVTRLFQGVASTLLGKEAFDGGTPTALLGVLMHYGRGRLMTRGRIA